MGNLHRPKGPEPNIVPNLNPAGTLHEHALHAVREHRRRRYVEGLRLERAHAWDVAVRYVYAHYQAPTGALAESIVRRTKLELILERELIHMILRAYRNLDRNAPEDSGDLLLTCLDLPLPQHRGVAS